MESSYSDRSHLYIGVCGKGFTCGTGVAANRCCPSGISMQQCAGAIVVNVASTVPPKSSRSKRSEPTMAIEESPPSPIAAEAIPTA